MVVKTKQALLALLVLIGVLPAAFLVGCSAHIKVVDQYGEPIEGVYVKQVDHQSTWLPVPYAGAGSNEVTERYSDEEGRLTLPRDWEGFPVSITEVKKPGYEFRLAKQSQKENFWGQWYHGELDLSYNNPLIIRGWKREEQPELTYVSVGTRIPDSLETCTIDLGKDYRVSRQDYVLHYEPINRSVIIKTQLETERVPPRTWDPAQKYELSKWRVRLEVPGSRVMKTDDLFMNLSPENGYQEGVVFEGIQDRDVQIFIKADDGSYYGGGILWIGPVGSSRAPDQHHIDFNLWFNLNGSRNIMRHPDKVSWGAGGGYELKCQELDGQ